LPLVAAKMPDFVLSPNVVFPAVFKLHGPRAFSCGSCGHIVSVGSVLHGVFLGLLSLIFFLGPPPDPFTGSVIF